MMINEKCLQQIGASYLLRDKIIKSIAIKYKDVLSISLEIQLSEKKFFSLNFTNVEKYCLFSDETDWDDGYLISHYKIFKYDDSFYFSFDPYTENQIIEEEDNNYIYSKQVVGDIYDILEFQKDRNIDL